jgi:hypothetical protein
VPTVGAVTEQSRWDEFEERLQFPNCPNGHGAITEEGLLTKVVANLDGSETYVEVGREGTTISSGESFGGDVISLLETILRLETPEPANR